MDAFARALYLLRGKDVSFEQVFEYLAGAEMRASFVCGFVELFAHKEYLAGLQKHMTDNGLIETDAAGHVHLMAKGTARTGIELPPEIEQAL